VCDTCKDETNAAHELLYHAVLGNTCWVKLLRVHSLSLWVWLKASHPLLVCWDCYLKSFHRRLLNMFVIHVTVYTVASILDMSVYTMSRIKGPAFFLDIFNKFG